MHYTFNQTYIRNQFYNNTFKCIIFSFKLLTEMHFTLILLNVLYFHPNFKLKCILLSDFDSNPTPLWVPMKSYNISLYKLRMLPKIDIYILLL